MLKEKAAIDETERLAAEKKAQLKHKRNQTITDRLKRTVTSPVSTFKVRVVGGGGMTNTCVTKEDKKLGYSPEKVNVSRSPTKAEPFSFDDHVSPSKFRATSSP